MCVHPLKITLVNVLLVKSLEKCVDHVSVVTLLLSFLASYIWLFIRGVEGGKWGGERGSSVVYVFGTFIFMILLLVLVLF